LRHDSDTAHTCLSFSSPMSRCAGSILHGYVRVSPVCGDLWERHNTHLSILFRTYVRGAGSASHRMGETRTRPPCSAHVRACPTHRLSRTCVRGKLRDVAPWLRVTRANLLHLCARSASRIYPVPHPCHGVRGALRTVWARHARGVRPAPHLCAGSALRARVRPVAGGRVRAIAKSACVERNALHARVRPVAEQGETRTSRPPCSAHVRGERTALWGQTRTFPPCPAPVCGKHLTL
jgi:hypothetical protein